MTTSLYGASTTTGEVASSNFTTLYGGSNTNVPVNVSGNTTYDISSQGVSGGANLVLTGSDTSIDNVKFQSGVGITVSSLDNSTILITNNSTAGTTYTQNASATTGGANLNLVGSDSTTDTVKFASGTGITVTRTDADTITITNSAPDTNTTYTINASATTGGANFNLVGSDATTDTIAYVGSGGTTVTRTDANTITISSVASLGGDVTGPASATDNAIVRFDGTTGKLIQNSTVIIADNGNLGINTASPSQELTVNAGGDGYCQIGMENTERTWLVTNNDGDDLISYSVVPSGGSSINRFQFNATTGNQWFNSGRLGVNTNTPGYTLDVAGEIHATSNIRSNDSFYSDGDTLFINYDNTAVDSQISFKGSSLETLKWNNTNSRFEFSDQLYISQTDVPSFMERQVTTATTSPYEIRTAQRMSVRVTDAPDNDTVITGPGLTFARTSGASDPTERLFASIGSWWDGSTTASGFSFNWSSDNFFESSPGVFPNSYSLLLLDSTRAAFFNNSIYIDYDTAGAGKVGINKTASATYNLDVNGTTNTSGQLSLPSMISNTVDPIFAIRSTSNTNSPARALSLRAESTGTPIVGFGTSLDFEVETSLTNTERAGFILIRSTDVTPGNEDFRMDFGLMEAGATSSNQAVLTPSTFNIHGSTYTVNADKLDVNNGIVFGRASPSTNAQIRWNATSDSFEWSSDGTTWYDFIDVNLTAPFNEGQLITYRSGQWINDQRVTTTLSTERSAFEYRPLSPAAGWNTALYVRKNYSDSAPNTPGVGTYADGAGVALSFQVASDTQTPPGGVAGQSNQFASVVGVYSATNPSIELRTTIDNGVSTTQIAEFDTNNASVLAPKFTMSTRTDIDTASVTTTALTQVPLITSTRNVMKAVVYISQGTDVHTVEALVLKTGASTAMVTTYGEMYNTTALATFDADTSGGSIRLLVTPANTSSMTFTSVITSLT